MLQTANEIFKRALGVMKVPENQTCTEWCDEHFYLSSESSNTSGKWKTTKPQITILNCFGNDAIEKVDLFKAARVGGTKMLVAAMAYGTVHKKRNIGFYQPTSGDSDDFVKTEVEPAIRDCEVWHDALLSKQEKSSHNTLSYKAFMGSNSYFRGGHSPNSFRRLTLDTVMLDELDGFTVSVGKEGNATSLSWGRIKNSVFKKQIQISTPTITGFSLIETAAMNAEDTLEFKVKCPCCGEFDHLHWGGPDVPYGFKWEGRDASTVRHFCKNCGEGWGNDQLFDACEDGYWQGENGLKTYNGIIWYEEYIDEETGEITYQRCDTPRHIAFKIWSAYSPFSPWTQIVEEFHDALGDLEKMKAFTNTTLGRTWDIKHNGTLTEGTIDAILRVDNIDDIVGVTAGIDVQDDRLEIHYVGHDRNGKRIVTLDYQIHKGDPSGTDLWLEMGRDVSQARFTCGGRELPVLIACIDTQGHHTANCHKFLVANKKTGLFVGINGSGTATYVIADKSGHYKNVQHSEFYTIGTNTIKALIYSSIRNRDLEGSDGAEYDIHVDAKIPDDFSKQLVAERMEVKRQSGIDRVVFTNKHNRRNEALDTLVYAIAAKGYVQKHKGRQGKALFPE